jgi:type II secretory pathway pseudopilin PulG
MDMKRYAFTMIELIFIILLIGILAAIAVPKMVATRDDAYVSKMGQNVMTASFEVASYVVAKGAVDPTMSNMSDTVKQLVAAGEAIEAPRTVTFKMGSVVNCVGLDINQSIDGTIEEIQLRYGSDQGDHLCIGLHEVIDEARFPIPLKGKTVVH